MGFNRNAILKEIHVNKKKLLSTEQQLQGHTIYPKIAQIFNMLSKSFADTCPNQKIDGKVEKKMLTFIKQNQKPNITIIPRLPT